MRAFDWLKLFGIAALVISWSLVDYLYYIRADLMVWIGAFTIIAEGLGFIGLSLVEITLFLKVKS